MSDLFSRMKDTINKNTKKIGAKSSNLIEVGRIKTEIANVRRKKQQTLAEIGGQVYLMRSEGQFDLSGLEELFDKVALFDQEIEDYNAEIDQLNIKLEERLKEADEEDVIDVDAFTEEAEADMEDFVQDEDEKNQ